MSALGSMPQKGTTSSDTRKSAPQHTSVGSGSRPGASRVPIETTSPKDHRTLDRNPPKDALK